MTQFVSHGSLVLEISFQVHSVAPVLIRFQCHCIQLVHYSSLHSDLGGSVAEWLACWTQMQKGLGSNRSRDAVLGKLFTPIVPLFAKQQNW